MHFSPSQALLGLLAALIPSALGAPANGTNGTYSSIYNANSNNSTNSTSGTSPSLAARAEAALVASPSNLACYKKMPGCKYKDVYMDKAKTYGTQMCNKQKGVIAKPGWEGAVAWVRNAYWVSYNMKVEWKEGCTAPGDGTMDVSNPAPGVDCFDVLWPTWINCKGNGGRGGKVDFGCLTYHYNIINGNEVGHGWCVNVPFDNSSLGGGY